MALLDDARSPAGKDGGAGHRAGDRAGAPLLELKGASRTLPLEVPVTLVKRASVIIEAGEFVVITGPSGSGKSSLLYLLGLLDRPSEGEMYLAGRPTSALGEAERARLRLTELGFVFQFHFLLAEFTCLGNVLLPIERAGRLKEAEAKARAEALLAQLDLAEHLHKYPDQLSGGQRQRVAIARALANDPAVLLADEPTGNLDTKNAQNVFRIFKELAHGNDQAVVCVTHDQELAALADRRVVIVDGVITEGGA